MSTDLRPGQKKALGLAAGAAALIRWLTERGRTVSFAHRRPIDVLNTGKHVSRRQMRWPTRMRGD